MGTVTVARPHDLVRVRAVRGPLPPWAVDALGRTPWAVVRRDLTEPGTVPVGIRGASRGERHAAVVDVDDIVETLTPATLLDRLDGLPDIPAAAALRAVTLDSADVSWGPGGSVGFTLATGVCVATAASDLDLVVRTGGLPATAELTSWRRHFAALPARVDCQLDLPAGGVALDEVLGDSTQVLLRTAAGPRLVSRAELSL